MKYYRLFGAYYHNLENGYIEKLSLYKHDFGIRNVLEQYCEIPKESKEITEAQFNRVKKLILAKLLNQWPCAELAKE
jgi:hypothetical protein